MGFGNNDYQQQQSGYKGLERFDITVRVIECIDLMGDLFTSLRFSGINRDSSDVYKSFINAFFKVFHITAGMLSDKDLELIADIEASFMGDLTLTPDTSSRFLTHFEDYLHAMKKAGIYDPAIMKQFFNPAQAWEKSI
jgi:hypothetical protein